MRFDLWLPISLSILMLLSRYGPKKGLYFLYTKMTCLIPCADLEGGGQGSGTLLENYKNIGFLSNTGPFPLKITKLPIQHSMLGHHRPRQRNAIQMAFCWRAVKGPLIVVFGSILSSSNYKKERKKKHCQSWTPSDKTFWIRACIRFATGTLANIVDRDEMPHNVFDAKTDI